MQNASWQGLALGLIALEMTHMRNPNHHLAIHGHFYQPPRENPWLGIVEPQSSASPYTNWNERITDECYARIARTPMIDEDARTEDLYNNFAHLSFNVGPSLYAWLNDHCPALCEHILTGDRLGTDARHGRGQALAQAYSHPILPLLTPRDRHTQIVWGARYFERTFGRHPRGMWLPECAINMDTISALIDHGIRFVILSPYQASHIRPFGEEKWRDVSDGSVDVRHPYRIFEVDGAGTTHFERYLDVVFYDPTLAMRISFEHLLRDPEALEKQILSRLDAAAELPQIITIATDGEVYGHHEPQGEATLSRLFSRFAPDHGIHISNIEEYLADNPPCWDARIWEGREGRGSSWSCQHGVERWYRNCGCQTGGEEGWQQEWRGPLRNAFDQLHASVNRAYEEWGEQVFHDPWDAREDYVDVLMDRSPAARHAFLCRHARREFSAEEEVRTWRLLEATTHAMLMYTSCGWFFADLAGIEPVQNMRYALRAAELAQPYSRDDLTHDLINSLSKAVSNDPSAGTGRDIFRAQVLPTRYTPEIIATSHVLSRMLDLPEPEYAHPVQITEETRKNSGRGPKYWGRLILTDVATTETFPLKFFALAFSTQLVGALVVPEAEQTFFRRLLASNEEELGSILRKEGILVRSLPLREREAIIYNLMAEQVQKVYRGVRSVYDGSVQLLGLFAQNRIPVPSVLAQCAEHVIEQCFTALVQSVANERDWSAANMASLEAILEEAATHRIAIRRGQAERILTDHLVCLVTALAENFDQDILKRILQLAEFCAKAGLGAARCLTVQDRVWHYLQHIAPGQAHCSTTAAHQALIEIAAATGFSPSVVRG